MKIVYTDPYKIGFTYSDEYGCVLIERESADFFSIFSMHKVVITYYFSSNMCE